MAEIAFYWNTSKFSLYAPLKKPYSIDVINLTAPQRSPAASEPLTEAILQDHGYSATQAGCLSLGACGSQYWKNCYTSSLVGELCS